MSLRQVIHHGQQNKKKDQLYTEQKNIEFTGVGQVLQKSKQTLSQNLPYHHRRFITLI